MIEVTENPGSVLLVTPRLTRDGGVATHVTASARALARRGVSVHILAAQVEDGEPIAGVTIHHSPELVNPRLAPDVRLGAALGVLPALTNLHDLDDPAIVDFIRPQAPVINSAHGYTACTSGVYYFRPGHECSRHHGAGCVPNLLARGCAHTRDLRWLPASYRRTTEGVESLQRSDLVLCYSSAIDRHLSANDVVRRKLIPLFATTTPRTGRGHEARRRVVCAGRVVAAKGIGVLLRAAREVDGEFVICGEGWQLEAMRSLARRLGVSERVQFKGWLGAEEIAVELAEASVVVVPSLWPEPFGLVGIEAFACGRPVVASATGGVVDWLQDGVSGLSVRPGDARALARALNELLADPARQRRMGEAGRAFAAAHFSEQRHVSALLDAYRLAREAWTSASGGVAQ